MPRISKVVNSKLKLDYGYLFDIQNYEDLQAWWENVRIGISTKDFEQARQAKDGKRHANHLSVLADMWGVDLLTALSRFQQHIGEGLDRVLQDQKRLFINSVGGYFGYSKNLIISDTRDIDMWALPTETVRIIQWPDGSHFYAKIGNTDVVVDGKQKWDSRAEAEAAGQKFLKGKKRQ
jgi:hypothetical protein